MFPGINKANATDPLRRTAEGNQGKQTTIASIKQRLNKLAFHLLGYKNQVEDKQTVLENRQQTKTVIKPVDDSDIDQFSQLPSDLTLHVLSFLDSSLKNNSVAKINQELRSRIREPQTSLKLKGSDLGLALNDLGYYPNVQRIRITQTPTTGDIERIANLQSSRQILKIDLSWCTTLTDATLSGLVEKCPDITSLNLSYCKQISDAGIAAVVEKCPHLKTLDLSWCNQLTDASVMMLANRYPNLTHLNLCGCMEITSTAITALIAACPSLKFLRT
jgi:F-box and leucine-rich repeat protein 2/20